MEILAVVVAADMMPLPRLEANLRAAADSELEARVLLDRYTVGIWAHNISPAVLRAALLAMQGVSADLDLVGFAPQGGEQGAAAGKGAASEVSSNAGAAQSAPIPSATAQSAEADAAPAGTAVDPSKGSPPATAEAPVSAASRPRIAPAASAPRGASAGNSLAYLHVDMPVRRASASWAAGAWHLRIDFEEVRAQMVARLPHVKLGLPGSIDMDAMRHADAALDAGQLAEAKAAYAELQDVYATAAWATLRQGDVALLEGDEAGACVLWGGVEAASPGRVAGKMAQLRARALRCADAPVPDWTHLLQRGGRDDVVGHHLQEETRWTLQWESDGAIVAEALAAGREELTPPLDDMLWARYLRRQPAFEVVRQALRPGAPLRGHPEGFDLALTVARALCDLDLPLQAQAYVTSMPAANWVALGVADRRSLRQRVGQCELPSQKAQAAAALARARGQEPNAVAAVEAHLADVQARLSAVGAHIAAEVPGPTTAAGAQDE